MVPELALRRYLLKENVANTENSAQFRQCTKSHRPFYFMTYSNRSEGTSICVPKDSTVSEGGPKKYPCYAANFMMVVMGGKAEIGV